MMHLLRRRHAVIFPCKGLRLGNALLDRDIVKDGTQLTTYISTIYRERMVGQESYAQALSLARPLLEGHNPLAMRLFEW